ncbi:cytosolic non-specific dipeptidase-like isoform X1 [Scomber scombrus]|uniref:Cytosolic non-specific dipeptidase n=1 Tax=Scomber scombrus TaxID=13677 RepID=A0AAV1MRR3_SCOSC
MAHLPTLFKYVDEHQDLYVQRLADWVGVQSVSAWPEKRGEIKKMMEMAAKDIEKLGGTVELVDVGKQKLPSGEEIPLPPIILGRLGSDPGKKTVCIYGHLDVQPAHIDDGWDTEPFTLVEKDGKMFGRGSTDDKGPVLAWFNCIEAHQKLQQELPINIKFCFEGMEESGSEGLDELVFARKDTFFKDVDYVCISDNYWLGKTKPCITYGLRGICYFFIEVECGCKDLHSGVFGGSVHEAMTDLIALMGSLVDKKGKILVPGMNNDVAPLTDEEKKLYEKIDFDLDEYCKDVGVGQLLHDTKERILNLLLTRLKQVELCCITLGRCIVKKIVFISFSCRNKSLCTAGGIHLCLFMVLRGLSLRQGLRLLSRARSTASSLSALSLTWTPKLWRSRLLTICRRSLLSWGAPTN